MAIKHIEAKSSWWSGTRTSRCGKTFQTKGTERAGWGDKPCPACKAAKKK
jgi:hypothetical protein